MSESLPEAGLLFFRQCLTIAAKDLRAEWRTKEALNASLAFSTVILYSTTCPILPVSLEVV